MRRGERTQEEDSDLILRLNRLLLDRTQGRIYDIQIEMAEDRLTVRGRAETYHAKQLALQVLSDVSDIPVELNIHVSASRVRCEGPLSVRGTECEGERCPGGQAEREQPRRST